MLKLPKIPYTMDKDKQQVVSMGNINYSKMTKDGDIADSSGVSGRHFPYITTAKECAPLEGLGEGMVSATYFRGEWATVDGDGILSYGGDVIGPLEKGEKQFAAINTKLVIMPDKKYLDVGGETARLKDLGAEVYVGATISRNEIRQDGIRVFGEIEGDTFSAAPIEAGLNCAGDYRMKLSRQSAASSDYNITVLKYQTEFMISRVFPGADDGKYLVFLSQNNLDALKLYANKDFYFYNTASKEWIQSAIKNIQYDNEGWEPQPDYGDETGYYILITDVLIPNATADTFISVFAEADDMSYYSAYAPSSGANSRLHIPEIGVDMLINLSSNRGLDQENPDKVILSFSISQYLSYVEFSEGIFEGKIYNGTDKELDLTRYFNAGDTAVLTFNSGAENMSGEVLSIYSVEKNKIVFNVSLTNYDTYFGSADIVNASQPLFFCFNKGDVVTVSESTEPENNISFKISEISENGRYLSADSDIFKYVKNDAVRIERRIPHMDYICEHGNRLYGCSNADSTIYVSALGDPTNIYAYEGVSTDSYAVAVASEGNFTGCQAYDGGVMFWKEHKLHKLLGSYPAEYALYTYNIDGVQEGSHKSLQNIGEVLFYKGERGVFAFDGSPRLISDNFGEKRFENAVAGNDGECYYISMTEDLGGGEKKNHFFSYNTRTGLWVREGDMAITEFIRTVDGMHMLADGEIYLYGADETSKDSEWFVQLAPIYETIEGKKSYSRIKMRIELPKESHMVVSVRCDGGRWAECGKIVGRVSGVVPVMVPINRCDKFELKISGKGPCTIHSILREYFVGSDNR